MMKQLMISILLMALIAGGCKKSSTAGPDTRHYFMSAAIDGAPWGVTAFGQAGFETDYDYTAQKFSLNIGGGISAIGDSAAVHNMFPVSIEFDFTFVPKAGRYYFNNNGSVEGAIDTGIMAVYTHYNVYITQLKWSTGGYVDIDSISKDEITGDFNFTCRGDITDSAETRITSGKFDCIFMGWAGMAWPGP